MSSDSWLLPPDSLGKPRSRSRNGLHRQWRWASNCGAPTAPSRQHKAWIAVPPPDAAVAAKLDQTALKELAQRGDRFSPRAMWSPHVRSTSAPQNGGGTRPAAGVA